MVKLKKTDKRSLAVGALIAVALGYSLLGIASRLLSQGFEPMTQVYLRIFFGFLMSLCVFRGKLRPKVLKTISRRDIFWLLVMGIVGYSCSVYFLTMGVLNAKLLNVAVIFAIIPFVVYVYSIFLLDEKIRLNLIALLLISLGGVSLIATHSLIPQFGHFGIGEFYVLVAVILAGWWSVGRKMLSKHLNNAEITSIVMFIAFSSGMIIAQLNGEGFNFQAFTNQAVLLGLFIGSVLNITATFFENFAFENIDVVFGNQLLLSENVFSLVLGYVFYQEIVSPTDVLGAVIILVPVYFANKILSKE